jgi:hypothetical protein
MHTQNSSPKVDMQVMSSERKAAVAQKKNDGNNLSNMLHYELRRQAHLGGLSFHNLSHNPIGLGT